MGFKKSISMMIINDPNFRKKVLLIDYHVGNHQSIINTLKLLKYNFQVSNKVEDIRAADCYILPGVGAFNEAMKNLHSLGIIDVLREEVLVKKKPLLGICLGMQVLVDSSEENGFHQGLGWIPGKVLRIKGDLPVPHVGWNSLNVKKKNQLFERLGEEAHFYFDHSFQVVCSDEFVSAICDYGQEITAAITHENIFGVQFHPEKSHLNGFKLYRGFFDYVARK